MGRRLGWALAAMVIALGCGGRIDTEIASAGDAGPARDGAPNGVDAPSSDECGTPGPEVEETFGNTDLSWDASVVHVVNASATLQAKLSLAPCTIVRFTSDHLLVVRSLDALGAPGRPVTFEMKSLQKRGATLRVVPRDPSVAKLEVVHFRNVFLDAANVRARVRGVRFIGPQAGAAFGGLFEPGSSDLVFEDTGIGLTHVFFVRGGDVFAVLDSAPPIRYPAGRDNKIGIDDGGEGSSWQYHLTDRGVPYRWLAQGSSKPRPSAVRALTFDPGVTIEFDPLTGLDIKGTAFVIDGTAERPVVLRGHAGTWLGLQIDVSASIRHATIVNAARAFTPGDACVPAAVQATGAIVMTRQIWASTFEGVTFRDLPGSAFVEAYTGWGVNHMAGHTYVNVAGCKQIVGRALDGTCPNPVPCAK